MANTYKTNWTREKLPASDMNRIENNVKGMEGKIWGTLLSNYGYNVDLVNLVSAATFDTTGYTGQSPSPSQAWAQIGNTVSITPPVAGHILVIASVDAVRSGGTGWYELRLTRTAGSGGTTYFIDAGQNIMQDGTKRILPLFGFVQGGAIAQHTFGIAGRVQTAATDFFDLGRIKLMAFAL